MQTVILAGGLGTRLGKLTEEVPKPMMAIKSKPFLEWQLEYLKKQNLKKILLLTGHRSEVIEAYFGRGEKHGVQITYSKETQALGTGGALLAAKDKLDPDFLLMFGDSFLPVDFSQMVGLYAEGKCDIVMSVYDNQEDTSVPFNVSLNKKNQVDMYYKKGLSKGAPPAGLNYVEAGVYVVKKSRLQSHEVKFCAFETDLLQPAINGSSVLGWLSPQRFFDIGTPERLNLFERRIGDYF